jgi:hypothetical protein
MTRVLEPSFVVASIFVVRAVFGTRVVGDDVAMRVVVIVEIDAVVFAGEVRYDGYATAFVVIELCFSCCEEECVGFVDEVLRYFPGWWLCCK